MDIRWYEVSQTRPAPVAIYADLQGRNMKRWVDAIKEFLRCSNCHQRFDVQTFYDQHIEFLKIMGLIERPPRFVGPEMVQKWYPSGNNSCGGGHVALPGYSQQCSYRIQKRFGSGAAPGMSKAVHVVDISLGAGMTAILGTCWQQGLEHV